MPTLFLFVNAWYIVLMVHREQLNLISLVRDSSNKNRTIIIAIFLPMHSIFVVFLLSQQFTECYRTDLNRRGDIHTI